MALSPGKILPSIFFDYCFYYNYSTESSPKMYQIWRNICSALGLLYSTFNPALAIPFKNCNAWKSGIFRGSQNFSSRATFGPAGHELYTPVVGF